MPIKTMNIQEPKSKAELGLKYFLETENLEAAYELFIQNSTYNTTFKQFTAVAAKGNWQKVLNEKIAEDDLLISQKTRRLALGNDLTAEEVGKELMQTAMEQMQLQKGEMSHKDIGKYLDIAVKIQEKWLKKPEVVINNNIANNMESVNVPDEVIKRIADELAKDDGE